MVVLESEDDSIFFFFLVVPTVSSSSVRSINRIKLFSNESKSLRPRLYDV